MASSSAECSLDKPLCSLVCGQDWTMCDIVWVSPQEHWSESESFHFFLQAPQWPCPVWKWFRRDHCCRGRAKPGCRIVGSSVGGEQIISMETTRLAAWWKCWKMTETPLRWRTRKRPNIKEDDRSMTECMYCLLSCYYGNKCLSS